jgi:transposase-like protein
MIYKWHNKYEAMGEVAFEPQRKNKRYSKELKIAAIKEYMNRECSLEHITNKYKISSISIFNNWVSKYNSDIEIKDYDPKPEVYMAKSRKTMLEERIEIVEYCISSNKNYKATAIDHGVNYAQVYTWTKKYLEFGTEGLWDKRGRKKSESELSEVEKLKLEVKKLEARNKYLEMESEVLKKVEAIESEMVRGSYKKRNTKQ